MRSDSSAIVVERGAAPDRDPLLNTWLGENGIGQTGAPVLVVVTPGTDDDGLHPRVDGLVGGRDAAYIEYPESFFPVLSGKADVPPFDAPTYQESRVVAEQQNLAVIRALRDYPGPVVYTGYSQGAEAVGNAIEQGDDAGLIGPNTLGLLVSDPRGPWGFKGWAKDMSASNEWMRPVFGAVGIDDNGARDPQDSGDAKVVSVAVQGDPVTDWQWQPERPAESLLVNLAGFMAIHSTADGPYGNLDDGKDDQGRTVLLDAGEPTEMHSGGTTYQVYDTYHPLALLSANVLDSVGIGYGDADLQRWDRQAEDFYPMVPMADREPYGDVPVEAGPAAPATDCDSAPADS